MTDEIKAAITRMQAKRPTLSAIWQNDNGTFSHHKDAQRQWTDRAGCETDLRFHQEWAR